MFQVCAYSQKNRDSFPVRAILSLWTATFSYNIADSLFFLANSASFVYTPVVRAYRTPAVTV